MNDHDHLVDGEAQLYALGVTGQLRAADIERHLEACETCLREVVAAEAAGASLAATLPPVAAAPSGVRRWFPQLAAAAVLALAVTTAIETQAAYAARTQLARDDGALVAIAGSHFGHTTLTAERGVSAKALYARDGAWYYVIAVDAPRGAHVLIRRGATTRDLGTLAGDHVATLFAGGEGRSDAIEIVAGSAVIAHGTPAF